MEQTNIEKHFEKLLIQLRGGSEKSTTELRDITGLGFYVVQNRLKNMQEKGLITRREDSRGTYWKVKNE